MVHDSTQYFDVIILKIVQRGKILSSSFGMIYWLFFILSKEVRRYLYLLLCMLPWGH